MKLTQFSGEQIVEVTNPDPFAKPILRSPVMHTPLWIVAAAQLCRWLWRLARFLLRHPAADLIAAALALAWRLLGWPGPVLVAAALLAGSVTWRLAWPESWSRMVAAPTRARWRRWQYQRQWPAVMTISRLAVYYRGRILLPLLGPVTTTGHTDRLYVRLVSGQSADDFAARADNLAHGFGAIACRIRRSSPGAVASNWSDATPSPTSSRRCPSRVTPTCGPSRSAAAKTAPRGSSGCTAATSCSRAPPARVRHQSCGPSSAASSPPSRPEPSASSAPTPS